MLFVVLGALLVGLTLGLLGSGGSILTVPVLVLFLQRPDKLAIAESLAIVGGVALFAATPYAAAKQVHWKSVLFFGLAGVFGAYLGACGACYCPGVLQMTLFGFVMLAASWMMLSGKTRAPEGEVSAEAQPIWKLMTNGVLVGGLTGLLGVGGGFLIVPALVLLSHLPMHLAVGTSLVIIAMNSFTGFAVQRTSMDLPIDWSVIVIFATIGIIGSFGGRYISSMIPQARLKQMFAIFIIPISLYILFKQYCVLVGA